MPDNEYAIIVENKFPSHRWTIAWRQAILLLAVAEICDDEGHHEHVGPFILRSCTCYGWALCLGMPRNLIYEQKVGI